MLFGIIPFISAEPGLHLLLTNVATTALIWVILAVSMNFITGTTGLLTLGHGAFYGIGAYTAALLSTKLGLSFMLTLPLSGVVAAICRHRGGPAHHAAGLHLFRGGDPGHR